MIRLSANLCFLFNELPFLDRFAAARDAGFAAVEFTFVYDIPPGAVAQACRSADVRPVLMNAPAGNLALGECGMAAIPGREHEFRESFEEALRYARLIGVPRIHVLAGNMSAGADFETYEETFVLALRWAAGRAAEADVKITVEPLNAQDRPSYFLRTSTQACALIAKVDRPNVRLQMDLYHHRITEGRPELRMTAMMPLIEHVQVAGVPGRHEPDNGVLDYAAAFAALERLGYGGYVGCEYLPAAGTLAGLEWARPYIERPQRGRATA